MGKINIFVEGWFHFKNEIGMSLMNSDKIEFHNNRNFNIKYDWIMNLSEFRDYDVDQHTGLIFGPQIMFPNIDNSQIPTHRNYTCNVLSKWVQDLCKNINPSINFCTLPFAVDINRFNQSKKNGKPVIYFKRRNPKILKDVINKLGDDFIIFDYQNGNGYNENNFLDSISKAPYAIWIGIHESQGFAFQETLSCNTPIFVIDVNSLRDEISPNSFWKNYLPGHALPATSASYFDETCGLICHPENWEDKFNLFINNLSHYQPRNFIINNLSPEACIKKWINVLSK